MAKNISYRGKKEVIPVEGKIPYDPKVWQVSDSGDYINTLTGEERKEDQFDFNAPVPKPSDTGDTGEDEEDDGDKDSETEKASTGSSEWDEYSQDTGGDFGGAQFKQGNGKSDKADKSGGKKK